MQDIIQYTLDGRGYTIYYPVGNSEMYRVTSDKMQIGYIHVAEVNEDTGENIWIGSNLESNILAPELGRYIEEVNM